MRLALYLTIWFAMAALVASEWAARGRGRLGPVSGDALSAAGLAACLVHILIAILHHHGGDHAAAVAATARQTEAVYGVAWGGGVWVNYAFVVLWAADLLWRRAAPARYARRRRVVVWLTRAFVFVIVVNAVVVFAAPATRMLGVALSTALLLAWRGPVRS